ncbi:ATP-binding transmembrane ABC transporter [Legionella birminghamensis]|uniref:ATP-binding transmembrane ABC transporter n=1 Tax=Legionella birminghamensis TaxID=28083 RepID=A0A378IDR4_9GAMM|nr:ABC transporter ATP-binding protein [Legionella birminghamensis]KTC71583.1 ATP-binding transmembrane ABC transporter [Legionella birminghamensis]STX32882.1 ATP-binding transmembrane ABC transporter [Legionella birminghamensis]
MRNPYFNLIKTVWSYGKSWRPAIVSYYIAYIIAQAFISLSPYTFGKTIDVLQHFSPGRLHEVVYWLVAGVLLLPLFWLFHGPARVVERRVALKIQQSFQLQIYRKLTELPLKWHQDHHSGNIITRLNRASTALRRFAEEQFIYVETIIKFIVSIVFLLWIAFPVGLASLLACLIAAFMVMLFDRKLIPLYESENETENHVGAGLFDYISNITTILTLRLAQFTENNLYQRLMAIWPFFKKESVLNEVKWFIMGMLLTVVQSLILIAYIVYHLQTTNGILIGTVVMIFRYQWELAEVFYNLSMHYSELVRMNTDVKSIKPIEQDLETLAHPVPGEAVAQQWHSLSISNLTFTHEPDTHRGDRVSPIHLNIKRGEKIALIGLSGAGKSTLLHLLSGLYQPQTAALCIDGVCFNSLEPLHAITTLIPQEPEIFESTIAFNITMDIETSTEVMEKAIDLACFKPVLEKLPKGLLTDIREKGLNLSVGQKQRLALARGLFAARFSSLILMDEPTSSVDLPTEKKILSGIIESYAESTILVTLHRLHLLPQFDRVILLEQGQIVADGPTSELLNRNGPVQLLWQKYQSR